MAAEDVDGFAVKSLPSAVETGNGLAEEEEEDDDVAAATADAATSAWPSMALAVSAEIQSDSAASDSSSTILTE